MKNYGLSEALFLGSLPGPVNVIRQGFSAIAGELCDQNDLDILVTSTSRGFFEFSSQGSKYKVLTGFSLSNRVDLIADFDKQVEIIKSGNGTVKCIYLIIHIPNAVVSLARLNAHANRASSPYGRPEIVIVNAYKKKRSQSDSQVDKLSVTWWLKERRSGAYLFKREADASG